MQDFKSPSSEVQVFRLKMEDVKGNLKIRDLLDVAEKSGVDVLMLEAKMNGLGTGVERLKVLAAFAWVTLRRDHPELTYEDILDGQVEVEEAPEINPPADDQPAS